VTGPPEGTRIGRILGGRFQLLQLIGRGGMGEVYRAAHLGTGGPVAIKVMDPSIRSAEDLARFRNEAEVMARLHHPNTVRIYDFGEEPDLSYLAMEFVEGRDLYRVIRPRGQGDRLVLRVLHQVAACLAEAHAAGVVHRDVKPGNIMLVDFQGHSDFVKVIDFGIAGRIGPDAGPQPLIGTMSYLSPEQLVKGGEADARSDLYSLGIVAYELLTGRLPFEGIEHSTPPERILDAHLAGRPTPLLDVKSVVEPRLAELVMRLIRRDPAGRPANASDIVEPIDDLHREFVATGPRPWAITAVATPPGTVNEDPTPTQTVGQNLGLAWAELGTGAAGEDGGRLLGVAGPPAEQLGTTRSESGRNTGATPAQPETEDLSELFSDSRGGGAEASPTGGLDAPGSEPEPRPGAGDAPGTPPVSPAAPAPVPATDPAALESLRLPNPPPPVQRRKDPPPWPLFIATIVTLGALVWLLIR
jgi:serine/threonine-protein kinase